jgi:hypothetical protein
MAPGLFPPQDLGSTDSHRLLIGSLERGPGPVLRPPQHSPTTLRPRDDARGIRAWLAFYKVQALPQPKRRHRSAATCPASGQSKKWETGSPTSRYAAASHHFWCGTSYSAVKDRGSKTPNPSAAAGASDIPSPRTGRASFPASSSDSLRSSASNQPAYERHWRRG